MRSGAGRHLCLFALATPWAVVSGCGPRPGAEDAGDLQRASLGEPATAALVVGCWVLTWDTGPEASALGQMPDSLRMRDEVVFGTRERLVTPVTHPSGRAGGTGEAPWEARFVLNRWWIEDDALRVRFSDGEREEWNVTLGVDTEELVGTARYQADPRPPDDPVQAGIRAGRIPCDF